MAAPWEGLSPPPGQRIPVDPTTLPAAFSLLDARRLDPGDWPHVVPGILPVGLVLVYGRPGVAKTTLSDQLEHCVAAGVPVAGWPGERDEWEPGRVLVIDYEGGPSLAIQRSERIARFGSLPTDAAGDPEQRIWVETNWSGQFYPERLAELEKRLRDAAHEGRPIKLVRIDTLRAFVGPVPQGANTAQFDSDCLVRLNRLACELGVCVVVIHHPNKAGEVSGSVAIEGSVTAAYKIERKPGESEGTLVCIKNRVGPERSWPMQYDQAAGRWFITDQIIAAQAANTGLKRAVIDLLVERGPATGPQIRAALAAGTTDATLRNVITRLANDGWIARGRDGVWALTEHSGAAGVAPCEDCGQPMTLVTPGQRTHPNCGTGWPEGTIGDEERRRGMANVVQLPVEHLGGTYRPPEGRKFQSDVPDPAGAEPPEFTPGVGESEPAVCRVCGLDQAPGEPHEDCQRPPAGEPRWPAVEQLRESVTRIRPRPLMWVGRDDKPGRAGWQHRDLPQWRAAVEADRAFTGYSYRRPGAVEEHGPGRLVLVLDKSQAFVSACETVAVAPAPLEHFGPFDCDPRQLGRPSAAKDGRPEGLAGIAQITCPEWDHPGMPHPLGPKARPGEPVMIPTNMLELLWRLHGQGVIGKPRVLDSWLAPRHTGVFKQFATAVREARAAAVHDSPADKAIKRGSSIAISQLRSADRGAGIYRPDWHAAIVAESMIRIWVRAWSAVQAGGELAGMGAVDEVSWLIPEDADPAAWLPDGYKLGGSWGSVRPKPVQISARKLARDPGAAELLEQLGPGRVAPADGHPGDVLVSGPLPLGLWVNRA